MIFINNNQIGEIVNNETKQRGGTLQGGCPAPAGGNFEGREPAGLFLGHISPNIKIKSVNSLKIYYEGTLVRLRCSDSLPDNKNHGGGHRGFASFSLRSRRRLMHKLATVSRAELPLFVTLTYPKNFSRDPLKWKIDLDNFMKNLKYHYAGAGAIWKLEPQRRGAPHYHLLLWGVKRTKKFIKFVSESWYRIVNSQDIKHLRAGTQVISCNNWGHVSAYASKYLGKVGTQFDCKFVGRFWGVRYGASIPFSDNFCWDLEKKEIYQLARIFRNYKKSAYREKAKNLEKKYLDKKRFSEIEIKNSKKIINNLFKIAKKTKARANDTIIVGSGDFWLSRLGDLRISFQGVTK